MHNTLLYLTVFATGALASPRPEIEVVQVRQVLKRQDISSIDIGDIIPSGCLPPTDLPPVPTPPADVVSALASWTDPCNIPTLTGQAGRDYSSYQSEIASWGQQNQPKMDSWLSAYTTACPYAASMSMPDLPSINFSDSAAIGSFLASNTLGLSQISCNGPKETGSSHPGTTKASPQGSSGTISGAASNAAATSASPSTGAAPQQTGFALAAGAALGIFGVAAVL